MGRVMAIDYGTRRTGVAVTDPGRLIATPLETVATHDLMSFLERYFTGEGVEILVVGRPVKMDGTPSDPAKPLHHFVGAFRKRFPEIRVEWMDERFTSRMAGSALAEAGVKRSVRQKKGSLDHISASLILQTWLERENNLRP